MKIVYANWPEGYYNLRFLEALVQKYEVYTFFFDETGRKIFRTQFERIRIPSEVKKIKSQDPPLFPIPLYVQLADDKGSIALGLQLLLRAFVFRRYINQLDPDLLIGTDVSGTNPYGFCSAFSGHHPFLVLVWGSDILVRAKHSRILRLIARYILRKADGVIVDSEVQKKAALKLGCKEDKIWKFPWGIDLEKFNPTIDGLTIKRKLGWENDKIVIITRNHFPIYGIEYLIRAIPIVLKEFPETRFLIVGDGPITDELKKMTVELSLSDCTHFAGKVPHEQLPCYLRAADIYVSTSFSDGTSASLLESMACGLPVVVTDLLGNNEWVQNGKNGFLVPARDSKVLAERIIYLLQNGEIREFMGRNNVELAKDRADWKKNVNVFYDAIQAVTSFGG